ncbi:MAG: response regulator transcription factor [Longimicrobiales bacterium]|nr:response regulator transcription factor [Longimicrobiales bacterium]
MSRILIIEDNEDLAFGLRRTLEFEGYEVDVAEDGEAGLDLARSAEPDLVVLDVMLPGMDGFDVLEELRGHGARMPVLMLTARDEEADVVMGFHSGADDYVTKPFSTLELVARVRALLRRSGSEGDAEDGPLEVSFGEVRVDEGSRRVTKAGEEVSLTPKEFDLLVALLRRDGDVASRPELLEEVWRYANTEVMTRTVDIHIAELRRKIEDDPSKPRYILTVRKAGYRLDRGDK